MVSGRRPQTAPLAEQGQANPLAAAWMLADQDKTVPRTDNPNQPFGEMSPGWQTRIGNKLGHREQNSVVSQFVKSFPFVGTMLSALDGANLINFTSPLNDALSDSYGKGTLRGLFGNYSDDPGIQAATEKILCSGQTDYSDTAPGYPGWRTTNRSSS